MDEKLVSICIPTRNQAQYITDTLVSAFAQTHPVVEVIVCDDASTDATAAVVQAFRAGLPAEDRHKLKYHRNPVALKIGGNFSMAVSLCQGDYVVKVDSDDILEPTFVETLYQALESHPEAGWAHCNVVRITADKTPIRLAHTHKASGYTSASDLAALYLRRSDTAHCVMLRMEAYCESGGYRPEMLTTEDRLLWIEMTMAGYGCCYVNQPLARMREFSKRGDMSARRRDYIESTHFMIAHLEKKWDAEVSRRVGVSQAKALRILRTSIHRTCLNASLVEGDKTTQDLLIAEANSLVHGVLEKVTIALYRNVPHRFIVRVHKLKAMPCRILKSLYMKITGRSL